MDAKITKQRLGRLLSYDWLKIVGIVVAVIIVWSLIFTMTATSITPAQQFTVFNHYANVSLEYGNFYDEYDTAIENGVFSYEILETDVIDLTTAGEQRYTMCDTRFATGQGDLMFAPRIADAECGVETDNGDGTTSTTYTHDYVESFFARYSSYMVSWDEYLLDAKAYLANYFGEDYAIGTLDKAKAERDFRARIKANNDKRFKRKSQIEKGIEDEFSRLEKYRDEFVQFEQYLASGLIRVENVQYKNENGEPYKNENGSVALEGNYALNICPDEERMNGLKNRVFYSVATESGTRKPCSKDMCVLLFDLPDMDSNFQYETVSYLNALIKASLTPTQA